MRSAGCTWTLAGGAEGFVSSNTCGPWYPPGSSARIAAATPARQTRRPKRPPHATRPAANSPPVPCVARSLLVHLESEVHVIQLPHLGAIHLQGELQDVLDERRGDQSRVHERPSTGAQA